MHLNIKDPEAHRLAHAIARETGESMTRVVTEALRTRYAAIQKSRRRASLDDLRKLAADVSVHSPHAAIPHGDLLYGDNGLPK